jgi:hypothetical protein
MLVRDAAIQLYNALVDACSSHPEHLAHFRLDPRHEAECSPPRIHFDMAFAQDLLEGRSHDADPIWFGYRIYVQRDADEGARHPP